MSLEAYILVGGHSKRFGRPKATFEVAGRSLTERTAATIRDALPGCRLRIVAANEPQLSTLTGIDVLDGVVFDKYEGRGPAGGLLTAAARSESEWAFVAACDLPLLGADLIRYLMEERGEEIDAVVPVQPDGRPQPLAAFYRCETVRVRLEAMLRQDASSPSIRSVLSGLRTRLVPFADLEHLAGSSTFFANVNSLDDLGMISRLTLGR